MPDSDNQQETSPQQSAALAKHKRMNMIWQPRDEP